MTEETQKPKRIHSEETKAKIAASMLGNKNAMTPSKYKAATKKRKARGQPRKKRTLTKEHRMRISIAMRNVAIDRYTEPKNKLG